LEAHAVKPTEIELFADLAKRVQDVLAQIAGGSLVIYGAGEHTKMLFQKTPIREGNVVAIADSDSGKWGSEVEGFQIISPTSLLEMNPDGILISSHAFEMEIFEFLVNELRISENKIFRLYGVQSDSAEEYSAEEAELITKRLKDLGYL
jgi:FlaA1/EpsC-like NDP-sugar epimerase